LEPPGLPLPPPPPPDCAVQLNPPAPSVCKTYPLTPPDIETVCTSPNAVFPVTDTLSAVNVSEVESNTRFALAPNTPSLLN